MPWILVTQIQVIIMWIITFHYPSLLNNSIAISLSHDKVYYIYDIQVVCTTISCTPTCKNRNQNDCHCVRAYMNI